MIRTSRGAKRHGFRSGLEHTVSMKLDALKVKYEYEPYKISFIGCRKGKKIPEEFKSINGNKANFELTKDILFVRCKITSSKLQTNPIKENLYETAWTQPICYNN